MGPRLLKKYREEVIPAMKEKFNIENSMAVPRLNKIVVNMGVGKAINDVKILDSASQDLMMITGQKPKITKARIAISNFKLKENAPIGCVVTLRRFRMYEFLDKLVNITLPRIRDFNGVPRKAFDKQGNYTLGLTEQTIFPEIEIGKIAHPQGMHISFVFNKGPKDQTMEVLTLMGMPFRKK